MGIIRQWALSKGCTKDIKMIKGMYEIPEEVTEDISLYRLELERFLKGEVSQGKLKPFRVTRGIYAQRGQKAFMVRIKLPAGGLTPDQMEMIANLSEKYGNSIPHVTSRQDMQIHWVGLEDTIKVMERLGEVGLTTKGGGGNTVRNITACADAGVCEREAFDVAPYSIAFTEYFLRHPKAFTLPRKFKIAFSGCPDDCAMATINDVGFIAKKKKINGVEKRGFRVYVAGGMGAYSRVADLLEDFIPEEDAINVAEAVMLLFDKYGNRRNKHKARLRFIMDRFGYDKFKRLYREEMEALRKEGDGRIKVREVRRLKDVNGLAKETPPKIENPDFRDWRSANVMPQKQEGFYSVKIRLSLGDIPAGVLKGLAGIVRGLGEGTIRTTHDQNMMIRWLREEDLSILYNAFKEIGLSKGKAGGVDDIMSCPGAATCNLGICLSRNMATVLTEEIEKSGLPLKDLYSVYIKIGGCPNSCAHHPVGPIGLQGAAKRVHGRLAPHYEVLVGGRIEEGKTMLGEPCGFVSAKNVPDLIKGFLRCYIDKKGNAEDFYSFLDRRGRDDMKTLIEEFSHVPSYEEDKSFYYDWGVHEEFSLAGLGPGECGAGVFDMIESDIDDAKRFLYKAHKTIEEGTGEDPSEDIYRALTLASKALLVTRGVEPKDDLDAFKLFEEKFVNERLVPDKFKGLQKRGAQFLSGLLDEDALKDGFKYVEELIDKVADLYESMEGDSLQFNVEGGKDIKLPLNDGLVLRDGSPKFKEADVVMNLKGVKCPINYVKAKIRMEQMEAGQTLLIYLDEGEPIRNVPSSLKNDGQEVLNIEKTGEHYKLLVKKTV
ncbi:MAG: sulfurtransferase TusA family protein [Thermodesulfobacteriota bacterium]